MKNYTKLLLVLALCVIHNAYSKNIMQGAPVPTLKGAEFSKFCFNYNGFVINPQGQVDPIWVGGAMSALMDDKIYSRKTSDMAWLLWNEIEGLANTFSEGNPRIKAAVEKSFDNTFKEVIGLPTTTPLLKTRPAIVTMPATTNPVVKTLPATRASRPVATRQPATPVSARTSFIERSQMNRMTISEITDNWLKEAMNIALNGSMLTSSNRDAIQQAMVNIAEQALSPSLGARGIGGILSNETKDKIRGIVAEFMMSQGTRF